MSFGGGGGGIHSEEPRVLSLRVNQSAYGVAKARVWGKQRVSGNLLWYGDFAAIPHTTTQSSGGGKGGGGVESTNTSYSYRAGMVIALCSGTISGVGKVWEDKNQSSLEGLGFTLKTGALQQSPWSHLATNYPAEAVSYSGIAYVANNAFDLGSSPSQPNLSFEVFGERIIEGGDDAAPGDVIYDIVADPLEGVGLPASVLAAADDYALWCEAMDLTVAMAVTGQSASRDTISQILKATLAEAIWSAGQIKIIPYGDEPVGNWVPDTSPVYDLDESDFQTPPRHRRKQPADAVNRVTVNFSSREKDYNTSTVMRDDLSAVTQFGVRPETLDLPCIADDYQAARVCEFWRDRNLYIRNTWEIDLDERYCLIEPMDLLTLTFAPQGLDQVAVRVVEVSDDGAGKVVLLVEEWPFGLLSATEIPTQSITSYVPEYNIAPGAAHTPVIFEAPNYLTAPNLEIWIGASGGDHWGGCNVWVSDNGDSYQQIGSISNPARHGVLSNSLAAGADPDTTHTLYVDMSVSGGQLLSGTQADADSGNTLCWVDGELIAFETATLTAVDRYALTYLRRGQKGTVSAGHGAGSQILRLDDAVFKYRVPRERIGSAVWIKLQSLNKYGRSPEPLDTVTPYQYTIAGNKPLPLATLGATGGMFEIALSWAVQSGALGIDYVELWGGTVNNRASAYQITSQKHPVSAWKHAGLPPGQTRYYWGRVIDTSGNASDFYPASPTGGIAGAPSADQSALLTQLQSALGMDQLATELAAPIAQIPGMATDIIQRAIDIDTLTDRVLFERAVTDATITVDPVTGRIQLLATAEVTTEVEARLTQVETDLSAAEGSLSSTVATVADLGADLSSAQTQISQLSDQVALKASTAYVDDAMASTVGAITVDAAAAAQALAESALRQALGLDTATDKELTARARIAAAEFDLQAKADELAAEASARLALAAVVSSQAAALTNEQAARATADTAEASARLALSASIGADIATVEETAAAAVGALGAVESRWGVKVQTMADGKRALAGIELLAGTDGESVFAVLADKLLIYKPDGTGVPKQVVTLGTVNGVVALGLDGNLIIDGSIVARHLDVDTLSAITASLGTVTAGKARNAANTSIIDLDATGAQPFIKVGTTITINADGTASFEGVVISRQMLVASGSVGAGAAADGYSVVVDTGISVSAWAATETYVVVASPNAGVSGNYTSFNGSYPEIMTEAKLLHNWRWNSASTLKARLSSSVIWPPGWVSCTLTNGLSWKIYKVT